jgi:uncharacterized pyridoxamine 5'-phosphate oxidase family protein
VDLADGDLEFLNDHRAAAMITVGDDGVPKAVRIGLSLIDGKLWASGTQARARTERLRRDPRCTLFVFDDKYGYLTLETTVVILDGPDAPALNLRLFRQMQGTPEGPLSWFGEEQSEEVFLQTMADEGRLIYEFQVQLAYGMH